MSWQRLSDALDEFDWRRATFTWVCCFIAGFCIWGMVTEYANHRISEELSKISCVCEKGD